MESLHDGRYTFEAWVNANRGNWCFAKDAQNNGEEVFIKEFVGMRHPPAYADLSNPDVQRKKKQFDDFVARMQRVTDKVKVLAGPTGSLVVTIDLFVEKGKLFKVTKKESFKPWSGPEVHEHMDADAIDKLMKGIAGAVGTLHTANILHCDLKPDNIFIVERNGQLRALVSDFDDSFFLDDIPGPGDVINTPPYLSPELVAYRVGLNDKGPSQLTIASDIFTLGLIYYEYLAGTMIFGTQTVRNKNTGESESNPELDVGTTLAYNQLIAKADNGDEYEYTGRINYLSDALDIPHKITILKMLRREAKDRLKNCQELIADINRYVSLKKKKTVLTVKNGASALANETVRLYIRYQSAVTGAQNDDLLLETKTDTSGTVRLNTGLPSDSAFIAEIKGKKYPVQWREDAGTMTCELQTGANTAAVTLKRAGSAAAGEKVEIYQKTGTEMKEILTGTSDTQGVVRLPENAPTAGLVLICDNYSYPFAFSAGAAAVALKPKRPQGYSLSLRRGGQPLANQPFDLQVKIGAKTVSGQYTTDGSGVFSKPQIPLFKKGIAISYQVSADGKSYPVNWQNSQQVVIDLPSLGTPAVVCCMDMDGGVPVMNIRLLLAEIQNGKPVEKGTAVTDSRGVASFGAVPPGQYIAVITDAPKAYAELAEKKKYIRFTVPESSQAIQFKFPIRRTDILLDQRFDPPRDGIVRLVIRTNGICELTNVSGGTSSVKRKTLGLYGLGEFVSNP